MTAWLSNCCQMKRGLGPHLGEGGGETWQGSHALAALSAGRLTFDVVAPLAGVATPETDAELAEAAVHWSVRQAHELARRTRGMRDTEAAKSFSGRFVRFDDARCGLWAQFTSDAYAIVKSTLLARATRHDHPSAAEPDYEPLERRLADALSRCAPSGGADGGSGSGASWEQEARLAGGGGL